MWKVILVLVVPILLSIGVYLHFVPTFVDKHPFGADNNFPKKFVDLDGKRMAYIEVGTGDPIVFLHGNPTSSYMWRNVIPSLKNSGRCIAPDLMGMGDSDKLDTSPSNFTEVYTIFRNREYLDRFFEKIVLKEENQKVTLVIHDWGSALGFDWAARNSDKVKGIVHTESLFAPFLWSDLPDLESWLFFQAMPRGVGDFLILKLNMFVENVLPFGVLRKFTLSEFENYRKPFPDYYSRQPILAWARQMASLLSGKPTKLRETVENYHEWLKNSPIPKLFFLAEPGFFIQPGSRLHKLAKQLPNQTEHLVKGSHFVPEDVPHEMGTAVKEWYRKISQNGEGNA